MYIDKLNKELAALIREHGALISGLEAPDDIKTEQLGTLQEEAARLVTETAARPEASAWLKSTAMCAAAELLAAPLRRVRTEPDTAELREHYDRTRELFRSESFAGFTRNSLPEETPLPYLWFLTVRDTDFADFRTRITARVIVSFTSYPARIGAVPTVLGSLEAQSLPPDEIILWLAEEQFPEGLASLPEELRRAADGGLSLRWCEDLKPHKKYYHTMQEAPDAVVITVDDDMILAPDVTEALLLSYIRHPDCVSAMRANYIPVSDDGVFPRYSDWVFETDELLNTPCMQLLATGCAGILYPPALLPRELFEAGVFMELCPMTDDLWLKAMELIAQVPVAVAAPHRRLEYVPGSQEEALWYQNLHGENDLALERIRTWVDGRFGEGFFVGRLMQAAGGTALCGFENVCAYERRHIERLAVRNNALRRRIEQLVSANSRMAAENKKLRAENEKLRARNETLTDSAAFRIGRGVTWLPRKVKGLFGEEQ